MMDECRALLQLGDQLRHLVRHRHGARESLLLGARGREVCLQRRNVGLVLRRCTAISMRTSATTTSRMPSLKTCF